MEPNLTDTSNMIPDVILCMCALVMNAAVLPFLWRKSKPSQLQCGTMLSCLLLMGFVQVILDMPFFATSSFIGGIIWFGVSLTIDLQKEKQGE